MHNAIVKNFAVVGNLRLKETVKNSQKLHFDDFEQDKEVRLTFYFLLVQHPTSHAIITSASVRKQLHVPWRKFKT